MIFLKGLWSGVDYVVSGLFTPASLYVAGQVIGKLLTIVSLLAVASLIIVLFCRFILWIDK